MRYFRDGFEETYKVSCQRDTLTLAIPSCGHWRRRGEFGIASRQRRVRRDFLVWNENILTIPNMG